MTLADPSQPARQSPHAIVMASAGTGKTFRLTGEFIRHAFALFSAAQSPSALNLSSILATTFTRKAAAEILDRILDRLSAAALDPHKLNDLNHHLRLSLSSAQCLDLLAAIIRSLHRLNIETIDAFFMRIAALFAFELGIPPGWRIAEPQEDDDLRHDALNALLQRDEPRLTLLQLERLTAGRLRHSVRRTILSAIDTVYQTFLLGDCRQDIWAAVQPAADPLAPQQFALALSDLETHPIALNKNRSPNKTWLNARAAALAALQAGDWMAFLKNGIAKVLLDQTTPDQAFSRNPIDPATRDAYAPLIAHARSVLLTRLRDRNLALHHFAARFHDAYSRLKSVHGLYLFDDIPRLLINAQLHEKLDDLYFRLDSSFSHLLLDEFQDTSIIQFQLLYPLLSELLSTDANRSVFCVGDPKQSLYAWRNAESSLMPAMPQRWPALRTEPLDVSHRSSPVITSTVNLVFQNLPANSALAAHPALTAQWASAFNKHSAARPLPGNARLTTAHLHDDVPDPHRAAALRAQQILRAAPSATVGILVRTNKHIPRLVFELKKLDIHASQEGGAPLLDSAPLAAAVSLIQLADFPADSAAAYHVAASPLGTLVHLACPVDPAAVSRASALVRARLVHDGYAAFLASLLRRAASAMDARSIDRFHQLIDLAQQFDARADTRPSRFVNLVRTTCLEDPSRSQVRIMSIHKAKGLEFHAVILPDLDREWKLLPSACLSHRADPFGRLSLATAYPDELHRALHPALKQVYDSALFKLLREELCCLYVAMTRAIHSLDMIIPPDADRDLPLCAARVLRAALAPDVPAPPGTSLWHSSPYQDWESRLVATPSPPAPQLLSLRLKSGSHSILPRRLRAAPPSSHAASSALAGIFSSSAGTARARGTLLHAWCRHLTWLPPLNASSPPLHAESSAADSLSDARLLALAAQLGWPTSAAAPLLPKFRAILTGPLAAYFRQAHYAALCESASFDVRTEWPFELLLPAADTSPGVHPSALTLTGRIDRLVLASRSAKPFFAHIIDFKSDDLPPDPAALAPVLAAYQPQLLHYARAVAHMFALPPSAVSTTILFLKPQLAHTFSALGDAPPHDGCSGR